MTQDINLPRNPLIEKCSCGGTGYIINEENIARRCTCREFHRRASVIGERFVNSTLSTVIPQTPKQKSALQIMTDNPTGSFMLYGPVRTGKTHFLAALWNSAEDKHRERNEWMREADIKEMLRKRVMDGDHSTTDRLRVGKSTGVYIDDLGKVERSGPYLQAFYEMIDEAYIRKARFCFTTVFSLDELSQQYGASITRRIEDMVGQILQF